MVGPKKWKKISREFKDVKAAIDASSLEGYTF